MDAYSNSGLTQSQIMALTYAFLIPFVIVTIIVVISCWKLFTKAGKPGWTAVIPFYNGLIWLKLIGKPAWWLILILLPCVTVFITPQMMANPIWLLATIIIMVIGLVFSIWGTALLSQSFGQGTGFTLGLIFLPFVFYPILAFSDYRYIGPAGKMEGVENPAV